MFELAIYGISNMIIWSNDIQWIFQRCPVLTQSVCGNCIDGHAFVLYMSFGFRKREKNIVIDYSCSPGLLSWGLIGCIACVIIAIAAITVVTITTVVVVLAGFHLHVVSSVPLGIDGRGESICLPVVTA